MLGPSLGDTGGQCSLGQLTVKGWVMSRLAALAAAPRLPVTHTLCSAGASQT